MRIWMFILAGCLPVWLTAAVPTTAQVERALAYGEILPPGPYLDAITRPETLLGHPLGQGPVTPEKIQQAIRTWVQQSPRLKLESYGRTHEGRPLSLVVVTEPERMDSLDRVQAAMHRLHDPRRLTQAEADRLLEQTPAVAWLAYSIHGNESSGADAALALLYWLAASDSEMVHRLLRDTVLIIDPDMNPDGRARFVQSMRQLGGRQPNLDHQALQHTGLWPAGRTNHYGFDLNRDFIYGLQPETQGRVRALRRWRPLFMIDAHEQGNMAYFLFSPPRPPINEWVHPRIQGWLERFAADQAAAFDRRGWPYFNGEWFEDLYPGYSSFIQFTGTLHVLYEQPRFHRDGIRRFNGRISAYAEAVDHQFTSTRVHLETLRRHRKALLQDYLREKRQAVAADGPFARVHFVVTPDANPARLRRLLQVLDLHGLEYGWLPRARVVREARDTLGREHSRLELPAGTLVIPARQPDARLLLAMLELDSRISPQVLQQEREELIRDGSSLMYDVTAWNLGMMFALPLYRIETPVDADDSRPVKPAGPAFDSRALAWILPNTSDDLPAVAARLMQAGIVVRRIDEAGNLGGVAFPAGSLAVNRHDQQQPGWGEELARLVAESPLQVVPVETGLGVGDLPDIGGERFRLLYTPRVGLLVDENTDDNDAGAMRWLLDVRLGLRHSLLHLQRLESLDLRSYNVLLLPARQGALPAEAVKTLETWVKQGGTLISSGSSSAALLKAGGRWLHSRTLPDALDEPDSARRSLHRQWRLQRGVVLDADALARPWVGDVERPWDAGKLPLYSATAAREKDRWLERFMPQGAFVAAWRDERHWLADGLPGQFPLLVAGGPVLIPPEEAQAVVRLGVLEAVEGQPKQPLLWTAVPEGQRLRMRVSGLLWPEAARRLAASAWLVRESHGRGQVVLFSQPPAFRGSFLAGMRMLANAIVLGPGMGSAGEPVYP